MAAWNRTGPLSLLLTAAAVGQTWQWQRVDGPDSTIAMTTDTARGRVVLCENGITWEWDGSRWLERASNAPDGNALLVFDTRRKRVVAVGPSGTWIWDGVSGTNAGTAPSSGRAALSYDSVRDRVVLWTGQVFEWDGIAWSLRGANAAGQEGRTMAFDPVRAMTVAVTRDVLGTPSTWTWDGANWTQVDLPNTLPPQISGMVCVWHPSRGRVVLVTASPGPGTFEWDGVRWNQVGSGQPPGRGGGFMGGLAHDPGNDTLLLFGGNQLSGQPVREQWSWNGSTWTQMAGATGQTRVWYAMGYDLARSRLVVTGGYSFAVGLGRFAGTGTWSGRGWSLTNAAPSPLRGEVAMAWDPNRQGLLLFGGENNTGTPLGYGTRADTWLWNGQGWSQLVPALSPPARARHAMVHDPVRQRVVLHGGFGGTLSGTFNDTWTWDGVTWTQHGNGPARWFHALACDPVRQRVVLSGGLVDETWEWDGVAWTQAVTPVRPLWTGLHSMTFDPVRRLVVLAVPAGQPVTAQTWTWDGSVWSQLAVAAPPPVVDMARLVFDPVLGRILMHNGTTLYALTDIAAGSEQYGSGCGGVLIAMGRPRIDAVFRVDLLQGPASAPALVGFAGGETSQPLGNGCTLLVQNPYALAWIVTNGEGFGSTQVDVPRAPSLRGAAFAAQAVFLSTAPPGFAVSNGLRLRVGD